jgi:hypothetical protein
MLGGDAWRHLCYALSLAEDLDDYGEVVDLMRAARHGCPQPDKWWSSMVEAMRPVLEEQPELLDVLDLPKAPNILTLALCVAWNMQLSPRARSRYP